VDELAEEIDRDRTTADRSLQRLQEAGIVESIGASSQAATTTCSYRPPLTRSPTTRSGCSPNGTR
jgi:predicted transcriptional regulator